jgi:hypothetical protein
MACDGLILREPALVDKSKGIKERATLVASRNACLYGTRGVDDWNEQVLKSRSKLLLMRMEFGRVLMRQVETCNLSNQIR